MYLHLSFCEHFVSFHVVHFCIFVWCMLGRRSLNLELISLDPNIDRTLRRIRRAPIESENKGEMGDQRDNIP
jgi:hypothetical protein